MANTYVLYNPFAASGNGEKEAKALQPLLPDKTLVFMNLTEIQDYASFFEGLAKEDEVILCGGDGTLNRFAGDIRGLTIDREIFYYATGTGNDFLHDLGQTKGEAPAPIGRYLKDLPSVWVNTTGDTEYTFLNGVGYGIDGYCCEIGDQLRQKSDKPVNYAGIAIKGLLFHFKPRNARVTVDGKTYEFKKVWIAPVMHGRFYGGGMMMAPDQVRNNEDGTLSLVLFCGTGKMKTLMIFPSIFKGEHVKHKKAITVLTGREFEVAFDRPTALQIDGETFLGVESYRVRSNASLRPTEKAVREEQAVAE